MSDVQFDEERSMGIPMPRARPVTMGDALLRSGIVSKPGDAVIILCIIAFICISASLYFLASAVPRDPPPLGHDVLRPGESVSNYVR